MDVDRLSRTSSPVYIFQEPIQMKTVPKGHQRLDLQAVLLNPQITPRPRPVDQLKHRFAVPKRDRFEPYRV